MRRGLLARHQAIQPCALELGADALRFLRAGERPDQHAVERAHVAHHGLVDLRLVRGKCGGVLAHDLGRQRLGFRLGAQGRDLDAQVPALLAGFGQGGVPAWRLLLAGNGAGLDARAAQNIIAKRNGKKVDKDVIYPTVQDGVKGVAFVEACIASSKRNGAWVKPQG